MLAAENFFSSQAMLLVVVGLVAWRRSRSGGSCWGRPRGSRRTATWRRGWPRSDGRCPRRPRPPSDKAGTGWIPESVSSFGERFAQSRGFGEKLDAQLEAAGQPPGGRVRRRHGGDGLLGAVLGAAILQKPLLAGVIGLARRRCRR